MATPLFLDIFSLYLSEELSALLNTATVEKCKLDIDERSLNVTVNSKLYLDSQNCDQIHNALKNALKLQECDIQFLFSKESFLLIETSIPSLYNFKTTL